MSQRFHLADAATTEMVGAALARALRGGMVVTLHGDLGSGKTTVVRGLLRALGFTGPVKSPTYTLVEHYPLSRIYFYHFDFYRFADPNEWETAGLAECFRDDAVCLVEWPERVAGLLPPADVDIVLTHPAAGGAGRELAISANTESGKQCLHAVALTLTPSRNAV